MALNSGSAVTERPHPGQNALISGIFAAQCEQIIIISNLIISNPAGLEIILGFAVSSKLETD